MASRSVNRIAAGVCATSLLAGWILLSNLGPHASAQDRKTKVLNDRRRFADDDHWIYNDLPAAIAEARATGKPILAVFRCVPCEACSEFDEMVASRDARIRDLMDQYVCLRIVHANGMDLSLFQFDYDQSLSVFLMNADKVIYGRFGTRSESKDESKDMTLDGFARALERALEWHKDYPTNKRLFQGKMPQADAGADAEIKPPRYPEEYPTLRGRYTDKLDFEGNVVQSCIHCHQVREAERIAYRSRGEKLPVKVLYPYPHPRQLGMELDARQAATVLTVEPGSIAAESGFKPGDEIVSLQGQPLLSIADVQWILHQITGPAVLTADVRRGEAETRLQLRLPSGWREQGNISWRATSWDLRRMGTGGLLLEDLNAEERTRRKLPADKLALLAKHVGQYGDHATAKNAGFLNGDVIVKFNGSDARLTESQLLAKTLNEFKPGSELEFHVLRDGRTRVLKFRTQ